MPEYSYKGQKQYVEYINNVPRKFTYRDVVLAKCYECMGFYSDSKQDCQGVTCPLYLFYPYKNTQKTD